MRNTAGEKISLSDLKLVWTLTGHKKLMFSRHMLFFHNFDQDICNINPDSSKMTSAKKSAPLGNNLLMVNWHDYVKNKIIIKHSHVKMTGTHERTQLFHRVCQTMMNHLQQAVALSRTEGSTEKADHRKRASCHPEEFALLRHNTWLQLQCGTCLQWPSKQKNPHYWRRAPYAACKLWKHNVKYIFLSDTK